MQTTEEMRQRFEDEQEPSNSITTAADPYQQQRSASPVTKFMGSTVKTPRQKARDMILKAFGNTQQSVNKSTISSQAGLYNETLQAVFLFVVILDH